MIEVQIRRPCREPEPLVSAIEHQRICQECGSMRHAQDHRPLVHRMVHEWVSLEEAVRIAHEEAAIALGGKKP